MRLEQLLSTTLDRILRPILHRLLLAALVAAFAIVAIYHFTVAGRLHLETQFGALQAQLIVAAIYTALALISYIILWAVRTPAPAHTPKARVSREDKIAMLLEAVMLGFVRSRKGGRAK